MVANYHKFNRKSVRKKMKFDKKMIIIIAVIIAVVGGGLVLATSKDPQAQMEAAMKQLDLARTEKEMQQALAKIEKLEKKYQIERKQKKTADDNLKEAFQGMKEVKNEGDGHKPDISGLFK